MFRSFNKASNQVTGLLKRDIILSGSHLIMYETMEALESLVGLEEINCSVGRANTGRIRQELMWHWLPGAEHGPQLASSKNTGPSVHHLQQANSCQHPERALGGTTAWPP